MLASPNMETPPLRKPLLTLLAAGAVFGLAAIGTPPAAAQQGVRLPDMGSSAGNLITPAMEAEYGAMYLRELRRHGLVLDDPLIDTWLQGLGFELASVTENSRGSYVFFMMRSRQVNAFATLGGHIGMNAGLVLAAESEDEVAAVLAHEIAHVTQQHILRAVEAAQRDQIPILLGMLAGVFAAQQAGSSDGAQAAIATGMSLMMQRQINHTRASEHEADRIGIQTLARAGYDPEAMAGFFGRMGRIIRAGGGDAGVPEFLRTHPVTTTRISEARDRAERIRNEPQSAHPLNSGSGRSGTHPMIPAGLSWTSASTDGHRGSSHFDLARERLRVLSAASPRESVAEYRRRESGNENGLSDAERYGYALAQVANGQAAQAATALAALVERNPGNYWLRLALAEALHHAGDHHAAMRTYDALHRDVPNNLAISLSHAQALNDTGTVDAGQRAQVVLRPISSRSTGDYSFQRIFARASELAGDHVRAAEAHAEVAFLAGRAEDALNQLRRVQQRDDLDYVQRARIDARITEITPIVLEMQRQGVGPDGRRRGESRS
jgi:beta-barrel assembly-enhancing protease